MKNNKRLKANESGIAHLGLIVLVLAVFGVAGFAGYRVMNQGGGEDPVALTSSSDLDQEDQAEDSELNKATQEANKDLDESSKAAAAASQVSAEAGNDE